LTRASPLSRLEAVSLRHGWAFRIDVDESVLPEQDAFGEVRKVGKATSKARRRERLIRARRIDLATFDKLSKQHRMQPDEQADWDLFLLRDFFGEHPVEVLADLPENWPAKVRAFCYATLDEAAQATLERQELHSKTIASAQRHIKSFDRHLLNRAMVEEFEPAVPKDAATLALVVRLIKEKYPEEALSVRASSDGPKWASAVLCSLGYEKIRGLKVNKTRVHAWVSTSVERWSSLYLKVLERKVRNFC